jgi:hypothetical protein
VRRCPAARRSSPRIHGSPAPFVRPGPSRCAGHPPGVTGHQGARPAPSLTSRSGGGRDAVRAAHRRELTTHAPHSRSEVAPHPSRTRRPAPQPRRSARSLLMSRDARSPRSSEGARTDRPQPGLRARPARTVAAALVALAGLIAAMLAALPRASAAGNPYQRGPDPTVAASPPPVAPSPPRQSASHLATDSTAARSTTPPTPAWAPGAPSRSSPATPLASPTKRRGWGRGCRPSASS